MSTITVSRTINAPLDFVFDTVSDIKNFSKAIDEIVDVEFLSEQESGGRNHISRNANHEWPGGLHYIGGHRIFE